VEDKEAWWRTRECGSSVRQSAWQSVRRD